jgi:hypothetical protein
VIGVISSLFYCCGFQFFTVQQQAAQAGRAAVKNSTHSKSGHDPGQGARWSFIPESGGLTSSDLFAEKHKRLRYWIVCL